MSNDPSNIITMTNNQIKISGEKAISFNDLVSEKKDQLVVVCFFAMWCAPCRRLTGMLRQIATDFQNAIFLKVDVDENIDFARRFHISGIPDVHLFLGMDDQKQPNEVDSILGLDNSEMREIISKHIPSLN